jgi:hypothetical protein
MKKGTKTSPSKSPIGLKGSSSLSPLSSSSSLSDNTTLVVQLLYQNKSKVINEEKQQLCGADKILMNTKDMRNLNIKVGSIVVVNMNNSNIESTSDNQVSILCKVWPSKTLSPSLAIVSRMWWPNLPSIVDQRMASISTSISM